MRRRLQPLAREAEALVANYPASAGRHVGVESEI
jgi:hypothetical protein